MKIHTHTGGLAATNGYLLVDDSTRTAALIDAPQNTAADFLRILHSENLTLAYLLLTHGHWDHLPDHKLITDAHPSAQLLIHPLDEPKLQNPGSTSFQLPFHIPPRSHDAHLQNDQKITVGTLTLHALHTPGHSPGHVVLHLPEHHVLFAGDLIFQGSIGRTDFPDCNVKDMVTSLRRVLQLPDQTRILSGHGPATTLGHERRTNPWFKQLGVV